MNKVNLIFLICINCIISNGQMVYTTPRTTITTIQPIINNYQELTTSTVIYWEKSGLEARTKITKIFQSHKQENQTQFFYDPFKNNFLVKIHDTINNETVREHSIPLPNIDGKLIFFIFDQKNKLNIYFDCPNQIKTSKISVQISDIKFLELFKNTWSFSSLKEALFTFKCNVRQSVQPGTIIYFNSNSFEGLSDYVTVLSFYHGGYDYSLELYENRNIYLILNGSSRIKLNRRVLNLNSDLYLFFRMNSLEIYENCSFDKNQAIGSWNTSLFNRKLTIETQLDYKIGNGINSILINAFCSFQKSSNSSIIDDSSKLYSSFLPKSDIIQQIDLFKSYISINSLAIDELLENEQRILFASRYYSNDNFFNRGINDYINGFSDGQHNFWLGLDLLNKVTTNGNFKLRIVAVNSANIEISEEYDYFKVGNYDEKFRLFVDNLLISSSKKNLYFFNKLDRFPFSTYDFGDNKYNSLSSSSGFWFSNTNNIINTFCFTCTFNNTNSVIVSLDGIENIESFNLKMYLVVINV